MPALPTAAVAASPQRPVAPQRPVSRAPAIGRRRPADGSISADTRLRIEPRGQRLVRQHGRAEQGLRGALPTPRRIRRRTGADFGRHVPAAPAADRSSAARNRFSPWVQTPWTSAALAGCLARVQGLCGSMYWFARSASAMISRIARRVVARLIGRRDRARRRRRNRHTARGSGSAAAERAAGCLRDEAGAAARDVDELADDVGVQPGRELLEVHVEIVDAGPSLAAK